jgi:polyisoprenoid-binding protein YceI
MPVLANCVIILRRMKQSGIREDNFPVSVLAALILVGVVPAAAQPRAIDTAKSGMTVHVYKTGVLSAFGHDHEISAPVAAGTVDVNGRRVEFTVNAAKLRVEDAKASGKDRAEIQATMLGETVLNASQFQEIRFRSTRVEPAGPSAWKVDGDLTLHGETHPVSMEAHESNGRFDGSCRFNFTQFGIKPVKVAGGAVRVKDEVQVQFEIQLAR